MSATDESRKSETTGAGEAARPSPMYADFLRRVKFRRKLILLCQIVLMRTEGEAVYAGRFKDQGAL